MPVEDDDEEYARIEGAVTDLCTARSRDGPQPDSEYIGTPASPPPV